MNIDLYTRTEMGHYILEKQRPSGNNDKNFPYINFSENLILKKSLMYYILKGGWSARGFLRSANIIFPSKKQCNTN